MDQLKCTNCSNIGLAHFTACRKCASCQKELKAGEDAFAPVLFEMNNDEGFIPPDSFCRDCFVCGKCYIKRYTVELTDDIFFLRKKRISKMYLTREEAKELILLLEELAQYPSEYQLEKYDYIKQVERWKEKLTN